MNTSKLVTSLFFSENEHICPPGRVYDERLCTAPKPEVLTSSVLPDMNLRYFAFDRLEGCRIIITINVANPLSRFQNIVGMETPQSPVPTHRRSPHFTVAYNTSSFLMQTHTRHLHATVNITPQARLPPRGCYGYLTNPAKITLVISPIYVFLH